MSVKVGVVIPARNEAKTIGLVIKSLKLQHLRPSITVVVDDSSNDDTARIAEDMGAYVIRIKRGCNHSAVGTPYLAFIINQGLNILKEYDLDFVMISGAETVYPRYYISEITKRMIKDKVVIASGMAINEPELSGNILSIRGTGRLINVTWFKNIGFRYPQNYGYETWLILKALSQGFKVALYRDIPFFLVRRTSMNISKAYFYGKAMKALRYPLIYVIGKSIRMALQKGIKYSIYMLMGFSSNVKIYESSVTSLTRYYTLGNALMMGALTYLASVIRNFIKSNILII